MFMNSDTPEAETPEAGAPESEGKETAPVSKKKQDATYSSEKELLPIDPELLEKASPELQRFMHTSFGMMMRGGPMPDPVAAKLIDKFSDDHVKYFLESQDRDTEREYRDAQRKRWFSLMYIILGLSLFAFLVIRLGGPPNPDLLEKLIYAIGGFICGLAGGYGYGKSRTQ
jgi:hypothetical protein